jgi:hypothetical protein
MFLKDLTTLEVVELMKSGANSAEFCAVEVDALHLDPIVVQNQFAAVNMQDKEGGTTEFILFNVTIPIAIKKSVFFKSSLITPNSVTDGLTKTCPIPPRVRIVIKTDELKKGTKFVDERAEKQEQAIDVV